MDRIPLTQLIELVTTELLKAQEQAKHRRNHVFQFDECELEMAFQIETGGQAGINVWVINVGGDLKKSEANTIRVKFKALSDQPPLAFVAEEDKGAGPVLGHGEGGA